MAGVNAGGLRFLLFQVRKSGPGAPGICKKQKKLDGYDIFMDTCGVSSRQMTDPLTTELYRADLNKGSLYVEPE